MQVIYSRLGMLLWSSIKLGIPIIKAYKNWPIVFADFFSLLFARNVVYTLRNGYTIKAPSKKSVYGIVNETWLKNIYTNGQYAIHDGDIVVDIGAHVGIFSLFAASKNPSGKIYSYEPNPDNYTLLLLNLKKNAASCVSPYQLAVSAVRRNVTLNISAKNSGGHSLQPDFVLDSDKNMIVSSVRLEDVIQDNELDQIDFLKIDCEGAEYDILFSTPRALFSRIKKNCN